MIENPDSNYEPVTDESSSYLLRIGEAEKAYKTWQDVCTSIEHLYANLDRMAGLDVNRELKIFWSTLQVIMPSIYAKAPVPVVVPRFKDRKPLFTVTSELLERCCVTAVQTENLNEVMLCIRDDLCIDGRGVTWVNFYDKKSGKRYSREEACPEHVDRRDFINEPARKWYEVGFVARRSWLSYKEMNERFAGKWDEIGTAVFKVLLDLKQDGGATAEPKCPVWEMWDRTNNKVVWVTEGVEKTLDEGEPHIDLEGFFPCPKPAMGTLQPGTLIPVPDFLQYKSQIEEINELTDRIHKLSEAVKVKAFYEAGSEVGDAVEAALATLDNHNIMVPVRNMSSLSMGSAGQPLIYWPVDVIVGVIKGLVELRNEIINNVYQIIGISDIMRGSTDSQETATAQQIKAEFGSVRIRDKQRELVRIARDTIAIMAEIMAEHFSQQTILDMSQMDIPTDTDIKAQVVALQKQGADIMKSAEQQAKQLMAQSKQQAQQVAQNPQAAQMVKQDPQAAHQQIAQAEQAVQQQVQQIAQQAQEQAQGIQEQITKLTETVTIEQCMKLLRNNKLRPFILDIETDSTIAADEQAEKQSRTEFVTALSTLVTNFAPLVDSKPGMAPMVGGIIKFALAPFRVGRELEGLIDEAVDNLATQASGPPPPNPDAIKAEAEAAATKQKADAAAAESAKKIELYDADIKAKQAEAQAKIQTIAALADQKATLEQRKHDLELSNMTAAEIRDAAAHQRDMQLKGLDVSKKAIDEQSAQTKAIQSAVQGHQAIKGNELKNAAQLKGNGKEPA